MTLLLTDNGPVSNTESKFSEQHHHPPPPKKKSSFNNCFQFERNIPVNNISEINVCQSLANKSLKETES